MSGIRERIRASVRNRLRQRILLLDAGEALPPVRELMKQYKIGRPSIDVLFDEFERKGLIVRKSRSGVYRAVAKQDRSLVPYIDIIVNTLHGNIPIPSANQEWFSSCLMTAFAKEATAHHCGVRMHNIKALADNYDMYHELFKRSDCQACIIVNQLTSDVTQLMSRYSVPWVSLFPQILHPHSHCICDNPELVPLQMEHLIRLGHSRIAMLDPVHPQLPMPTFLQRREAYYRIMAENCFKVNPRWIQFADEENALIRMFTDIFSTAPRPTAIILPPFTLVPLFKILHSLHLRPGVDVAIVVNDDLPFLESMHPTVTSVSNNPRVAAHMAFDMLEMVLRGNEPETNQCIPLKLIERETSCPPNTQIA